MKSMAQAVKHHSKKSIEMNQINHYNMKGFQGLQNLAHIFNQEQIPTFLAVLEFFLDASDDFIEKI